VHQGVCRRLGELHYDLCPTRRADINNVIGSAPSILYAPGDALLRAGRHRLGISTRSCHFDDDDDDTVITITVCRPTYCCSADASGGIVARREDGRAYITRAHLISLGPKMGNIIGETKVDTRH
jgi:hypothetical protein